ncbi:MAG: pyridoxamine 5'-phosphate oxidase family protein [Polyangiaceae bacterium]
MADFQETLDDELVGFIGEQKLFFIATAPRHGRINLSPKGMDTLRVLDNRTVAYLDLTGSGNETAAHIDDDGRVTMMFCSFGTKPNIVRLYGQGEVVRPQDPRFDELAAHFDEVPGARQIIVLMIHSVQSSCGYAVPFFSYEGERRTLEKWATKKGEEGLERYRARHNGESIDGHPVALPRPAK